MQRYPSQPGYTGQAADEATICKYQVEGRPLGGNSLELRPEWWGRLGFVKIKMQSSPDRGTSKCKGPEVKTSLAYYRNRKTNSGPGHGVPLRSRWRFRIWYSCLTLALSPCESLNTRLWALEPDIQWFKSVLLRTNRSFLRTLVSLCV